MNDVATFRWRYYDDASADFKWSAWHTATGPCAACCCEGPRGTEHQEPSEYEDEIDGMAFLTRGHTSYDVAGDDFLLEREVETRGV